MASALKEARCHAFSRFIIRTVRFILTAERIDARRGEGVERAKINSQFSHWWNLRPFCWMPLNSGTCLVAAFRLMWTFHTRARFSQAHTSLGASLVCEATALSLSFQDFQKWVGRHTEVLCRCARLTEPCSPLCTFLHGTNSGPKVWLHSFRVLTVG